MALIEEEEVVEEVEDVVITIEVDMINTNIILLQYQSVHRENDR